MNIPLLTVAIRRENDILLARKRSRQISQFLGFSSVDSTRITTALSEVARNAFEYCGGGSVSFAIENGGAEQRNLVMRVTDKGPGIPDVGAVLSPGFKSRTGLGIGLRGSAALMDRFVVTSAVGKGTTVEMSKALPWSAARFGQSEVARLVDELASADDATPFGELQVQNQALLNTLQALTNRQTEIDRLEVIADGARQVAARSLVVRERFMALTTHELRTPLNAVMGYLDLLDMELEATLTEKQKDYFLRAHRACRHLLGLTNDFLDMAQGDAGRLSVARHMANARDAMSEACALVAPQAAVRSITIRPSEETRPLRYLGDCDRVRQVLVNIIGNAVSFTPSGGSVDIIAARFDGVPPGSELSEGPWCSIRVEDMGPGIPPDKLEHVFEPFVQLSSDGQATRKGSGLGLTVSRQLARLMEGDLTATSSGAGAVFTLWLVEASRLPERSE